MRVEGLVNIFKINSCVSIFTTDTALYIYHLAVWVNLNFLHNSPWIIFPTQLCQALYSFWISLLPSLFMWVTVSSLSPRDLHLLFCSNDQFMLLYYLSLWRCFLKCPFLSHVQIFSSTISPICCLNNPYICFSLTRAFKILHIIG